MNAHFIPLESVIRRAPVAIRFIDALYYRPIPGLPANPPLSDLADVILSDQAIRINGQQVRDGLDVTAHRLAPPPDLAINTQIPQTAAQHSAMSGIYGFSTLPGLTAYEFDRQPASDFWPVGGAPNFAVTAQDRSGRFLPLTTALRLPWDLEAAGKLRVVELPLFSGAARAVPEGFGALRAQIWDRTANRPAAWALLSAVWAGTPALRHYTLADGRGVAALFVPYPSFDGADDLIPDPTDPSPPPPPALHDRAWTFAVQVFYRPSLQRQIAGLAPEMPPVLLSLFAQRTAAPVTIVTEIPSGGGVPILTTTLSRPLPYRQDLSLATVGALDDQGKPVTRLLIEP